MYKAPFIWHPTRTYVCTTTAIRRSYEFVRKIYQSRIWSATRGILSRLNYKHCYLQTSLVASTLQRVLHLFRHFADESSFAARPPGRPLRKATAYASAPPMPGADADKSLATPQYSNGGQGGVPSSQCTLLPRRKFGLPCPIAYARSCRVLAVVLMFNSMVQTRETLPSSNLQLPFVDPQSQVPTPPDFLLTLVYRLLALGGNQ